MAPKGKFQNSTSPPVIIHFCPTCLWTFLLTVLTKVTNWHFEISIFKALKKKLNFRLHGTLWEWKLQNVAAPIDMILFNQTFYLNVPCDSLWKSGLLGFWNFIHFKRLKFSLTCPYGSEIFKTLLLVMIIFQPNFFWMFSNVTYRNFEKSFSFLNLTL